ncbi:MAG: SET domain-containing protein-lysine N-methyltransferase [Candidatus Kerfeldbacteria bacterium]|nr:SET domain-containing protein-lysine N-methyltransferase [Candidatus Kerfeldbacteria bacterium]
MIERDIVEFNKNTVVPGPSKKGYGYTYYAKKNFRAGEIVVHGFGKIIDHQTGHISVQIGIKKHFLPRKWTGRYWNHSCEPNCYIKTRKDGFPDWLAMKNIKKGEELTFSYYMTEYEWAKNAAEDAIVCGCESRRCRKKIVSFAQLTKNEQRKNRHYLSKYLLLF